MIWLTSDTHLGHHNIIKYCDRPFKNVSEMNEHIISEWNRRIQPDDHVYHLGDFAMGDKRKFQYLFGRLGGHKHLVIGNHDGTATLALGWETIDQIKELKIGKTQLVLCHYAMRVWHHSGRGVIQLYGHSHGILPPQGRQLDVGVDSQGFKPICLQEILEQINSGS